MPRDFPSDKLRRYILDERFEFRAQKRSDRSYPLEAAAAFLFICHTISLAPRAREREKRRRRAESIRLTYR